MPSSGSGSASSQASAPPAPTRRSLAGYRRRLTQAEYFQSLTLLTTTSAGNAGGTTLVSTELAGGLDTNRYHNAWVYVYDGAQAGQLRRVGNNALNTTSGELTVSVAFGGQIAQGVGVEIHRLLPPIRHDGYIGVRECINNALQECWVPRRLPITGVANQLEYALSAYADVLDIEAIHEFYGPADSATHPWPYPGWHPVQNGEVLNLQVLPTLSTGDASLLGVTVPGDTYVRRSGVWQQVSTEGLVNDADEALFDPGFLTLIALAHAYSALASGPDSGAWVEHAQRARRRANLVKLAQLHHPDERPSHGVRRNVTYGPKDWRSW